MRTIRPIHNDLVPNLGFDGSWKFLAGDEGTTDTWFSTAWSRTRDIRRSLNRGLKAISCTCALQGQFTIPNEPNRGLTLALRILMAPLPRWTLDAHALDGRARQKETIR